MDEYYRKNTTEAVRVLALNPPVGMYVRNASHRGGYLVVFPDGTQDVYDDAMFAKYFEKRDDPPPAPVRPAASSITVAVNVQGMDALREAVALAERLRDLLSGIR